MLIRLTVASLEAFIALLTSFGNPSTIPLEVDAYMAKTQQMEKIEEMRTIPDFDRVYALWEDQFTGEITHEQFEQELEMLKATLRA